MRGVYLKKIGIRVVDNGDKIVSLSNFANAMILKLARIEKIDITNKKFNLSPGRNY
jgi:hypothetical protein